MSQQVCIDDEAFEVLSAISRSVGLPIRLVVLGMVNYSIEHQCHLVFNYKIDKKGICKEDDDRPYPMVDLKTTRGRPKKHPESPAQ